MLTVEVAATEGLGAVNEILSDAASLAQVKHVNEEAQAEDVFDNYQLKMSLSLKPIVVGEDETGQVKTEERIVFELGRLTPIEIKLAQLGLL